MKATKSFGGALPFRDAQSRADGSFTPRAKTGPGAKRTALFIAGLAVVVALIGILLSALFGPHA